MRSLRFAKEKSCLTGATVSLSAACWAPLYVRRILWWYRLMSPSQKLRQDCGVEACRYVRICSSTPLACEPSSKDDKEVSCVSEGRYGKTEARSRCSDFVFECSAAFSRSFCRA